MNIDELINWHELQLKIAEGWVKKHRGMNQHGRAYHDLQADKHEHLARIHAATLIILEASIK